MMKKYGQTKKEKMAEENRVANEIRSEIMDGGVSQRTILKLIHGLALELEEPDTMRDVTRVIRKYLDNIGDEPKEKDEGIILS